MRPFSSTTCDARPRELVTDRETSLTGADDDDVDAVGHRTTGTVCGAAVRGDGMGSSGELLCGGT
jgi:hypothetical protein